MERITNGVGEGTRILGVDARLHVGDNVATADINGDGLSNLEEFIASTNPDDPDTDSDTFGDGAEVVLGSDPGSAGSTPVAPSLVYVDFGFSAGPQGGTLLNPFVTLEAAAEIAGQGATIRIKGDADLTTGPVPQAAIDKRLAIEAFRGSIRIE